MSNYYVITFSALAYLWGVAAYLRDFDDYKWPVQWLCALTYPVTLTAILIWMLLTSLWQWIMPRGYLNKEFGREAELRRVLGWETRSGKEFGIFAIGELGHQVPNGKSVKAHLALGKRSTIIGLMTIDHRYDPKQKAEVRETPTLRLV